MLERAAALKLLQAAMGTKESHYAEEVLHLAAAVFQSLALSSKCFSADFFSMLGALILLTPLDQTARQNFLTHAQYKKSERHWLEIELQKVIQARDELTLPGEGSLASLLLLNGFIPRGEKMEQFQDDVRSELAKCL